MPDAGSLTLSFAAGTLSTLSPCVLPLLPMVLLGAIEKHAWGPLALAGGLSTSFTVVGVGIATIGFNVGLDPSTLRLVIAAFMLGMGVVLLIPLLQSKLSLVATPLATGGQTLLSRLRPSGVWGQFAVGLLLGAIWSPCTGPTLGAAVGLAAQGETIAQAAAVMTIFGLGAATPILALAYGSRQTIIKRRDWLARVSRIGKPLMGVTLAGIGAFVLSGLDKIVEASLTRAMPDWLVSVTTRF